MCFPWDGRPSARQCARRLYLVRPVIDPIADGTVGPRNWTRCRNQSFVHVSNDDLSEGVLAKRRCIAKFMSTIRRSTEVHVATVCTDSGKSVKKNPHALLVAVDLLRNWSYEN